MELPQDIVHHDHTYISYVLSKRLEGVFNLSPYVILNVHVSIVVPFTTTENLAQRDLCRYNIESYDEWLFKSTIGIINFVHLIPHVPNYK